MIEFKIHDTLLNCSSQRIELIGGIAVDVAVALAVDANVVDRHIVATSVTCA
jgi:hypothetical protein